MILASDDCDMGGKWIRTPLILKEDTVMSLFFALFSFLDPYDDDLKVKTQRPRSADQPGVFQAQTGESP